MKIKSKTITLLLLSFYLCSFSLNGQIKKDSAKTLKNTIRINLTNPMLFGERYTVVGYERVIGQHQSFSVDIGRFSLPRFVSPRLDSLQLKYGTTDKGFTFAADYRFYLKKENKYNAPRGVFLGPYYSFNYLERTNTWSLNTSSISQELETNLRLNANLVGAQMGYQFVIKNRLSIDLILFGPGVWFYSVKTKISTNLSADDESLVFEKINEFLAAKLPGHELTINPGEKVRSGSFRTSSGGFRYLIHLGFRF
jgi:hypothetical protein